MQTKKVMKRVFLTVMALIVCLLIICLGFCRRRFQSGIDTGAEG